MDQRFKNSFTQYFLNHHIKILYPLYFVEEDGFIASIEYTLDKDCPGVIKIYNDKLVFNYFHHRFGISYGPSPWSVLPRLSEMKKNSKIYFALGHRPT
ncbi:MAG: hypothetical protein MUE33_00600 [Cytophagaceae bacterium]|jgi:hypothetical protein|nr:hypothetical protein [Cytophagaceae bacterium]